MKTYHFITGLLVLLSINSQSQSQFPNVTLFMEFGPKQTPQIPYLIVNKDKPMDEFQFGLEESKRYFQFGISKNFRFQYPFFGSIGVAYARRQDTYRLNFTHTMEGRPNTHPMVVKSDNISMPVGLGVRLKPVEIVSGFLAQYAFTSSLSGDMTMGIELTKPKVEIGWYTGLGVVVGNTQLGVKYQAMLHRNGSNLLHRQKTMEQLSVPGNFSFSVGFGF